MTIDEAIRNNTVPSDFEAFKKFFDILGIEYEIPADNLIYLSDFEVEGSQLIVVKFYEDGKFQEFCPYPEGGLTELKDLREENKVLTQECDRLIYEKGELLTKSEQIAEYKQLLKLAVEDIHELLCDRKELDGIGQSCNLCSYIDNCSCCNRCDIIPELRTWRYADEALKLIGEGEDV